MLALSEAHYQLRNGTEWSSAKPIIFVEFCSDVSCKKQSQSLNLRRSCRDAGRCALITNCEATTVASSITNYEPKVSVSSTERSGVLPMQNHFYFPFLEKLYYIVYKIKIIKDLTYEKTRTWHTRIIRT